MSSAETIMRIEDCIGLKAELADRLCDRSITHSPHVKDWFFDDGSILRLAGGELHDISMEPKG